MLVLAWIAGALLGAIFFGGLCWTVGGIASSRRPAARLLGSVLLRFGIALAGFYFVAEGHWQRLLLCLLGFVIARSVVMWLTRPDEEARHAPQS